MKVMAPAPGAIHAGAMGAAGLVAGGVYRATGADAGGEGP